MEVIKISNSKYSKLKTYRKKLGMTLEEVANIVGVNRTTIQRYESGAISNIPIETMKALSELYRVSVDELLNTRLREYTKDLFIEFIESLDFKCINLYPDEISKITSTESPLKLSLWIQSPNGDEYEVTQDDILNLKTDLQDYLAFQFFKIGKKK